MPTPLLNLEVRGELAARRNVDRVVVALHGAPMVSAMNEAAMIVERQAKINAPVDTGRLRASIAHEVRPEGRIVVGVVGSNVFHAAYMEEGTGIFAGRQRVRMPPAAALDRWARRHGFSSGYAVAFIIWKRGGLRPRHFLKNAFESERVRVVARIGQAVAQIVRSN